MGGVQERERGEVCMGGPAWQATGPGAAASAAPTYPFLPTPPRPTPPPSWVMFDDASACAVGDWADVRRRCEGGRVQPSVLFYEAEFQDS